MKNECGVTLMELVIVAVVIGLMSALAVPSFLNYSSKLEAKSAARNITSVLRLARSRAISERVQYGVFFDAGNRRYTFFKDKVTPNNFQFEVGDSIISQVTLDRDVNYGANTFTNTTVVFKTDGGASSSGDLQILPASGGDTYNVNVLASTGRVKLATI
jgi:Tfp pilus assembly protein FimT